ncbi:hypothetical protein HYDPIDRAFT_32541 [Hydnomerulius pinastri MD-312]|uniref:Proline dehydrogenase n=1 Tax=Hydnomerulius pinastri MD-312 TaxID=994086 RepID=A0A0C9V417_9AGAM|nr:hypothetical protein HYDPIDRAFT_32541 [Hydnomerulius pinastri MD-312]
MFMIRRGPLLRCLPRSGGIPSQLPRTRPLSTSVPTPRPRTRRPIRTTLLLTSTLSLGALTLTLYTDAKTCPSPPFQLASPNASTTTESESRAQIPLSRLLRTYFVYGLISIPTLVDHAPGILDALLKVPLLGNVVEGVVRGTFFEHFVGGETAHGAYPLLSDLRNENKGVLFAYSVEVDEEEAAGAEHHGQVKGEGDAQPVHKRIVNEMIRSIDVAADFEDGLGGGSTGRRTWVAVKLTALLPRIQALQNLSLHLIQTRPTLHPAVPFPGTPLSSDLALLDARTSEGSPLTSEDVKDLKELYDDLNRICTRAKERGVRVILDAEYSWYQPAIDAFGHAMMERFNKLPEERGWVTRWYPGSTPTEEMGVQPLVYVTYQAYLRRTPTHLAHSLTLAREKGYALGVKLVRGAYHPHELAAHATISPTSSSTPLSISPEPYPPVHPSKPDTDACYNECAAVLVRAIADDVLSSPTSSPRPPRIGVLFGTHNWTSSELVLGELVKNGLAREEGAEGDRKGTLTIPPQVAERFTFGQLYGMSDSLTNYLVGRTKSTTPCVIKYVPYGALVEVMPYLSRRAIENKSVLGDGGATRERKEAAALIWKRMFGGIGL